MKRKVAIRMPTGGISEVAARGKQPPATTLDALNMRGIDGRTGRVRIAGRQGTRPILVEPLRGGPFGIPQPVRFGHVGQYFEPTDDFELLETPLEEKTATLLADGVAIVTAADGKVYALDSAGRIVIYDRDLNQTGYVPSPVPAGFSIVRRIAVDESGAIYVGATAPVVVDGRASEIYRITQPAIEGDRMSVAWTHPIEGTLRDFDVRSGTLAYLYDLIIDEDDDQDTPDQTWVDYLGALASGLPVAYASSRTTLGAWRVRLNRFGDAIVASPRDARRGSTVFDVPVVSWTPREIATWEDDVYFWVDAAAVKGDGTMWTDGAAVSEINDAREREDDFGVTNDTVSRPLKEWSGFGHNDVPDAGTNNVTWSSDAFGLAPAFVIPQGGALRTEPSTSTTLTDQFTILPVSSTNGKWSLFMTLQVPSGVSGQQRVFTQYAGSGDFGITIDASSGNITLRIETSGGGIWDTTSTVSSAPTGYNSMALLRLDYDPAGSGPLKFFCNGELISTTNVGAIAAVGSFTTNSLTHDNPISIFGAGVDFRSDYVVATSIEDWPNPGGGSSGAVIQKGDTVSCDVGASAEVAGMEIRSLDTGFRNATRFRVEADDTSSAFGAIVYTQTFEKQSGSFQGIYRFLFDTPISARYIRLVLEESLDTSSTGTWRINEIKLYTPVDGELREAGSLIHLHEAITIRGSLSAGDALKVEGYMAHKVGGGAFLVDSSGVGDHTYTNAPPAGLGDSNLPLLVLGAMASADAQIVKHDTTGAPVSIVTETRLGNGGIGYGLAIDEDGGIYTVGGPLVPGSAPANAGPSYVKLVDLGSQFTALGGFIQSAADTEWSPIIAASAPVEMHVDTAGIIARALPDGRLVRTSKGGVPKSSQVIDGYPWAFAFPPEQPQYGSSTDCGPEFVYQFGDLSVDKFRLVSRTASTRPSTRRSRFLAVAGANLVSFDETSSATVLATDLTPTRSTVFAETVFGETFIADGKALRRVKLGANTADLLRAKKGAGPDPTSKLIALWDGRLVVARGDNDPHNFEMSAQGDVYDWDEFPTDASDARAVSGNSATQDGRMPGVINAIIPINDQIIVFGCEGSIHRYVGNPAGQGQRNVVSHDLGMAFGKAWCRDPRGTVYFMADRGGIYVMGSQADSVPFGGPEAFTVGSLHDEMQQIDFSLYRVHMEWSDESRGMHVFLIPLDALDLVVQPIHYFFEIAVGGEKRASWWKDQFAARGHQVSSVWRGAGDRPEDRTVLLGCRDGMIRELSRQALDDSGERIPAHVWVGPFPGTMEGAEVAASHLQVSLALEGGAMLCGMYASRTESPPARPVAQVELVPGMNPPSLARAKGNHLWFRLEALDNTPPAVEAAWINIEASGEAKAI